MSTLSRVISGDLDRIDRELGAIRPFDKAGRGRHEIRGAKQGLLEKQFKRSEPQALVKAYRGTPEAMVKAVYNGGAKNGGQLKAQFDYLTSERETDTILTDSPYGAGQGEEINEEEARAKQIAWSQEFAGNPRLGHTTHMIVSFPKGTDRESAHEAAMDFATRAFADNLGGDCFDYLAFTHTDTEHPHTHFVVKNKGLYEGNWFSLKRDGAHNLQALREIQVETAAEHGIELTATNRFERGLSAAPKPNAAYRAEKEGRGDEIVIDPSDTAPYSRYSPEHEYLMRLAVEDHSKRLTSLADGLREQNLEGARLFAEAASAIAQGKELDMNAIAEQTDRTRSASEAINSFESFRKEISDHIKVVENNIDAHPNKLVKTSTAAQLANFKAKVAKFFPERDDYKDFAENRGATVYDSAQFLGVREASNDDAMRSAVKSIYDDARRNIDESQRPVGLDSDAVIARFESAERVNKELAEQYQREDVKAVMDAGNIDEATANERVEAFYNRASKEVQEASKAVTDFLSGRGIVVEPDRKAEEVDRLADEIKDLKKSQSHDRNGGFDR